MDRIKLEGPIPMSTYMSEALLHPEFGYYTTRDPFGQSGDFTTAPEVSQMFGEVVALCLAQAWLDQGAPKPFVLAELGPGRGTLMADVLRTIRVVPGMREAAQVVLVEASPTLRAKQTKSVPDARHVDHVSQVPDGPLFLLANEFFDALPIRQFQRGKDGWGEVYIGAQGDAFVRALRPAPGALPERLGDTTVGDIVEVCPALAGIVAEIAHRIETFGGAALIFDYGDWRSLGDTVQALRAHTAVDPLTAPGTADITAHVDFEAIANAAPGQCSPMVTQGVLLERLGITARAQELARGMEATTLENHIAAHRRLTHPDEMGHLFKAIAIAPSKGPMPPGFVE